MYITNLENEIIQLKEHMAIVLENNKKLLSSNSKLEIELLSFRDHLITNKNDCMNINNKGDKDKLQKMKIQPLKKIK